MNSPFESINQTGFPLVASQVGEYVLHWGRAYSVDYLPNTTLNLTPGDLRQVIVWRAPEDKTFSLDDGQKSHLDRISRGRPQVARARDLGICERLERNRAHRIYDNLQVRSACGAVTVGACADLLKIRRSTPSDQEGLTDGELTICRLLGMDKTDRVIARELGVVARTARIYIGRVREKNDAKNRPHLMRRLFEMGTFQVYSPRRTFGNSSINPAP